MAGIERGESPYPPRFLRPPPGVDFPENRTLLMKDLMAKNTLVDVVDGLAIAHKTGMIGPKHDGFYTVYDLISGLPNYRVYYQDGNEEGVDRLYVGRISLKDYEIVLDDKRNPVILVRSTDLNIPTEEGSDEGSKIVSRRVLYFDPPYITENPNRGDFISSKTLPLTGEDVPLIWRACQQVEIICGNVKKVLPYYCRKSI
jgi:hypothetical protein